MRPTPCRVPCRAVLGAALLALVPWALPAQGGPQVDVLLLRGTVVDGRGGAARVADVGITGDRITFVGDACVAGVRARETVDVTGRVVAPGFIDPHTHAYGELQGDRAEVRRNAGYLLQGVTTVVVGNDGSGPADVGAHLARWASRGIGTNAALYVGFGTIRAQVLGMSSAAPDAAQLARMRALVARGMDDGALGLSTGLYYAPQSYAATDEVVALAREAAARGGIYDSHLRDESSYSIGLLGAVREALQVGREAGLPVHIAHIKALGTDVWGQSDSVVALVAAARAAGQRVTADQYPYTASGTSVGASLLPRWAEAGGRDSLRARVHDPATKARLLADMAVNMRRRGGAPSLLITSGRYAGRTLAQVAEGEGRDPLASAIDLVLAGDAGVASFNMQERDIVRLMRESWVFTGSDGSDGHPRKFGTFPRKLREYVLGGARVLTLEQFVQRSSGDVAAALGIAGRGVLAPGMFADVVVMDTARVRATATYEAPTQPADGMVHVLVNGAFAVRDGVPTTALAGRGLRRGAR